MCSFMMSETAMGMLEIMSNAYESWSKGWWFRGKKLKISIALEVEEESNAYVIETSNVKIGIQS